MRFFGPKGKRKVIPGTPPTPDDPAASNQTVLEYDDGISVICTSKPTAQTLWEYEGAIAAHPHDAEIRLFYGMALRTAGRIEEAIDQTREAIRLNPDASDAHSALASLLAAHGEVPAAVTEMRRAIELIPSDNPPDPEQAEAMCRWSLAGFLREQGEREAARTELAAAIQLQKRAVKAKRGSPQLLVQLRMERMLHPRG